MLYDRTSASNGVSSVNDSSETKLNMVPRLKLDMKQGGSEPEAPVKKIPGLVLSTYKESFKFSTNGSFKESDLSFGQKSNQTSPNAKLRPQLNVPI